MAKRYEIKILVTADEWEAHQALLLKSRKDKTSGNNVYREYLSRLWRVNFISKKQGERTDLKGNKRV